MPGLVESLTDLRTLILARRDPAWAAKMLQPVPELPTIADRAAYLVSYARDQVVLDLGCTGPIAARIKAAARGYYGVDVQEGGDWTVADLATGAVPVFPDVTLIVASELLEHLTNPGLCLTTLKGAYPAVPLLVTVPNAGAYRVEAGCEVVNGDHVAWYSMTTITALLTKTGWTVQDRRWYHGAPHRAEGVVVRAA